MTNGAHVGEKSFGCEKTEGNRTVAKARNGRKNYINPYPANVENMVSS